MGTVSAEEIAVAVEDGLLTLEQAITEHLSHNHYPPVPLAMVPVCIEAIEAYDHFDFEHLIDLPTDITWQDKVQAPAWAVVDDLHLLAFVKPETIDILQHLEKEEDEAFYHEED